MGFWLIHFYNSLFFLGRLPYRPLAVRTLIIAYEGGRQLELELDGHRNLLAKLLTLELTALF